MIQSIRKILAAFVVAAGMGAAPAANAGIPVIDVSSLTQQIMNYATQLEQLISWWNQYEQMTQQIGQLDNQINSMTGSRGLGDILNNPALKGVVPADLSKVYRSIETGGYSGMTGAAKAIRDARKIYDCGDLAGLAKTRCESSLSITSQHQADQESAMEMLAGRGQQIDGLRQQINLTTDPKSIAELQARLAAEQAQVENDSIRISLMEAAAERQRSDIDQALKEQSMARLTKAAPRAADSW